MKKMKELKRFVTSNDTYSEPSTMPVITDQTLWSHDLTQITRGTGRHQREQLGVFLHSLKIHMMMANNVASNTTNSNYLTGWIPLFFEYWVVEYVGAGRHAPTTAQGNCISTDGFWRGNADTREYNFGGPTGFASNWTRMNHQINTDLYKVYKHERIYLRPHNTGDRSHNCRNIEFNLPVKHKVLYNSTNNVAVEGRMFLVYWYGAPGYPVSGSPQGGIARFQHYVVANFEDIKA